MTVYKSPFPSVEKFDNRGVFSFIFEDNAKWKDSDIALIDANTNVKVSGGDVSRCMGIFHSLRAAFLLHDAHWCPPPTDDLPPAR